MKHKHHDIIVAWAADTTQVVEVRYQGRQEWYTKRQPGWHEDYEYRIKPQPKPDVVRYYRLTEHSIVCYGNIRDAGANNRVVFDGETGDAKSSEVLS